MAYVGVDVGSRTLTFAIAYPYNNSGYNLEFDTYDIRRPMKGCKPRICKEYGKLIDSIGIELKTSNDYKVFYILARRFLLVGPSGDILRKVPVHRVIIESQLGTNAKCSKIQSIINQFFSTLWPTSSVISSVAPTKLIKSLFHAYQIAMSSGVPEGLLYAFIPPDIVFEIDEVQSTRTRRDRKSKAVHLARKWLSYVTGERFFYIPLPVIQMEHPFINIVDTRPEDAEADRADALLLLLIAMHLENFIHTPLKPIINQLGPLKKIMGPAVLREWRQFHQTEREQSIILHH